MQIQEHKQIAKEEKLAKAMRAMSKEQAQPTKSQSQREPIPPQQAQHRLVQNGPLQILCPLTVLRNEQDRKTTLHFRQVNNLQLQISPSLLPTQNIRAHPLSLKMRKLPRNY